MSAAAPDSSTAPRASRKSVALIALFAGAIGIATAPIFVRWSEASPIATAFWRGFLAIPFAAAWAWWSRQRTAADAPQGFEKSFIAPAFFFAGDLAVWHLSIMMTSVANSTLEANLAPIFVALYVWLVLRQRIRGLFVLGLVIAIVGMFILIGPNFGASSRALWGDALGVATAVFYAGYILTVTRLRERYDTATLMFWNVLLYSLMLLPLALVFGPFWPQSAKGWATVLGLAFVAQFLGQSLIAYAMAHLPATFSSVGLYVQPVAAALFAWALLAESIGWPQLIGGAVVIAGIVLAKRGSA